ncbi:MAG: SprT family zinc-dependent metalloprotease [Pseudomonadota bacterium]
MPAPIGAVRVRRLARAKRLTLRVRHATGEVELTAPPRVRRRELERFVAGQAGWIAARRAALPAQILPAAGDSIDVLGAPLLLASGPKLHRAGDRLDLPGEGARYRAALAGFLNETARGALAEASDRYAAMIGVAYTRLSLRDTRARWGSCSSAGRLMFSWRLVLAPRDVLEYVAAHEVAHLREMNHGLGFWALVEEMRPSFREERSWLRRNGAGLHRYRFDV